MASFYGNVGSISSTTSAEEDETNTYTALTGTDTSPIILDTLEAGIYAISGYYTYTADDQEIKAIEDTIIVTVLKNTSTTDTLTSFSICIDNTSYTIYTIVYEEDGSYSIITHTLSLTNLQEELETQASTIQELSDIIGSQTSVINTLSSTSETQSSTIEILSSQVEELIELTSDPIFSINDNGEVCINYESEVE